MQTQTMDDVLDRVETFAERLGDIPADVLARYLALPIHVNQIFRLQKRTDSWMDRPTHPAFIIAAVALPTLVHRIQDSYVKFREVTEDEVTKSLWASELPIRMVVKEGDNGAGAITFLKGERVFAVPVSYFRRSEETQRRLYDAAVRTDTTHLEIVVPTMLASAVIERAIWHGLVGERTSLSRRRAVAFVGLEFARQNLTGLARRRANRKVNGQ